MYTASLEVENEKLREALAAAQLELDTYKKENPIMLHGNLPGMLTLNTHTIGSINTFSTAGTNVMRDFADNTIKCDFRMLGVPITKSDMEHVVETNKIMQEFIEASLWKKIKMVWTLFFTKKTSKKE
jgi:uncharacterized protein (UPF0276 family)